MTAARSTAAIALAALMIGGGGAVLRARGALPGPTLSSPATEVRLLWWDGRTVQNVGDSAMVVQRDGRLFSIDRALHAHARAVGRVDDSWRQATIDGQANLWLTDANGVLQRIDTHGNVQTVSLPGLRAPAPVADASSGLIWLARSTDELAGAIDAEPGPLFMAVDARGVVRQRVGRAHCPAHALLEARANAGHLVANDSILYFAPFIRDQLVAMKPDGDTLWVVSRGLAHSSGDPVFEVHDGRVVVNYHPVNLGLAMGPDGRLYVLSTSDGEMSSARLDVFDRTTGTLLESHLKLPLDPTVSVDTRGRVQLLAASAVRDTVDDRRRMPSLRLKMLDGGRLDTDTLRSKVVLVNLWASWCAPCRAEMPALDTLQRQLPPGAVFVSINEDTKEKAARNFLTAGGFAFPVAMGGARLHKRVGAQGLPVTLLFDQSGREVRRWVGFAGPQQIREISSAITATLKTTVTPATAPMPHEHHH